MQHQCFQTEWFTKIADKLESNDSEIECLGIYPASSRREEMLQVELNKVRDELAEYKRREMSAIATPKKKGILKKGPSSEYRPYVFDNFHPKHRRNKAEPTSSSTAARDIFDGQQDNANPKTTTLGSYCDEGYFNNSFNNLQMSSPLLPPPIQRSKIWSSPKVPKFVASSADSSVSSVTAFTTASSPSSALFHYYNNNNNNNNNNKPIQQQNYYHFNHHHRCVVGDGCSSAVAMCTKKGSEWQIGERIRCLHQAIEYEAKITYKWHNNGVTFYRIHYVGWNQKWDETVGETEAESRFRAWDSSPLPPGMFNVERLCGKRFQKRRWEYRVRWEGFDETEDTWEPEYKLITDGCEWAIDEYEEKNGGSSSSNKYSNDTI
ncbi:hypothetical protein niasHS_000797 [Heterodera schachtii]|uniref:Chromo domain-containing protein n=1 Tax=Heterodera schachtii TaxID=97005 RepID=A0ABD2K9G0_HETSC